jgi:ornithine carbamoyltransferase
MHFNKEQSEENIKNTSTILSFNHIDAVMVRDFTLSALDCGFDSWLSQTKDSIW